MFWIRNALRAQSLTGIAGEAMEVGMLVKFVQNTATGLEPKVMKALEADYDDPDVLKGVVQHIPLDDENRVDYVLNPATQSYTLNTGTDNTHVIASGTKVTVWFDVPIIGVHKFLLDPSLDLAVAREGDLVTFDSATSKLAAYDVNTADRDVPFGIIYRVEGGVEVTAILHRLNGPWVGVGS